VRDWPALDLSDADDLVLAALDDFAPTAIEERGPGLRVFFATREQRDAAAAALGSRRTDAESVEVSDEDWAARSQQNLQPVSVGRITIVPAPTSLTSPTRYSIVITPSMGFGTGHHATTRLCLAALQVLDLSGTDVLDVGTGSGVLAIAAVRLGADRALGIDVDPDAIQSAEENLQLNGDPQVSFAIADVTAAQFPPADIVLANLTGSMLVKCADRLLASTRGGGTLVLSGVLSDEGDRVREAFSTAALLQRTHEDEWVCLMLKKA
jgi:ribosomal protein L11 methyltransferase